jgi:hypothetical protein
MYDLLLFHSKNVYAEVPQCTYFACFVHINTVDIKFVLHLIQHFCNVFCSKSVKSTHFNVLDGTLIVRTQKHLELRVRICSVFSIVDCSEGEIPAARPSERLNCVKRRLVFEVPCYEPCITSSRISTRNPDFFLICESIVYWLSLVKKI